MYIEQVLLYANMPYQKEQICMAMRTPVVVDGRNVFDLSVFMQAGLAMRAVGKG